MNDEGFILISEEPADRPAQTKTASAPETGKKKEKSKTLYLIAGVLVLALSVVGVLRLLGLAAGSLQEKKRQAAQEKLSEYNRYLIPVAAVDMEPFDDISAADPARLIELAVWTVLNNNPDPAGFSYAEDGSLLVPVDAVGQAFADYFGVGVAPVHQTVEGYGYRFVYDPARAAYRIPLATITPVYLPRVTNEEERGDTVVLTCGFVNAGLYAQDPVSGELTEPAPDKVMFITLRTAGGARYISAVQTAAVPETAMIPPATEAPPVPVADAAPSSAPDDANGQTEPSTEESVADAPAAEARTEENGGASDENAD